MSPSLGAPQFRQICREKKIVFWGDNNMFTRSLRKHRTSKQKPNNLNAKNCILDIYIVQVPCACGCNVEEETRRNLLKKKREECIRLFGASLGFSGKNAFYDGNQMDRKANKANRKQSNDKKRSLGKDNDNCNKTSDKGAKSGRGPGNRSQQKVTLGKKVTGDVQSNDKELGSLQKLKKDKEKSKKRSSNDKAGKTNRGSKDKKMDNNSGNGDKSNNGHKGNKSDKRNKDKKERRGEKDKGNKEKEKNKENKGNEKDKENKGNEKEKGNKGKLNSKGDKDDKSSFRVLALQRSSKTNIKSKKASRGSTNTEPEKSKQKRNKGKKNGKGDKDGKEVKGGKLDDNRSFRALALHRSSKTDMKSKEASEGSTNREHENSKNTSNKKGQKGSRTALKKGKRALSILNLPSRFDEIRICDIMRIKLEDGDLIRW